MFWMFKKKQKDVNDYYKNELMRSRMSDISIRTDEIIQQYFFVAKEDSLTLDEYLKIRELATQELGLDNIKKTEIPNEEKHQDASAALKQPISNENNPLENDCFHLIEQNSEKSKTISPTIAHEATTKDKTKEIAKDAQLPFDNKSRAESLSEPVSQPSKKEEEFDFLGMLQSIDD